MEQQELIYDWNAVGGEGRARPERVELDDETLRDGLQSPSVTSPPIERKMEILRLMDAMGIDSADVGLPGAGPQVVETVRALVRLIADEKLRIRPNCAARTLIQDAEPCAEITQETGIPIETCLFIGSSPIRQYAEDWDLDRMLRHTEESVNWCVEHGLPVMYVTEDTTRARPETLKALYSTAISCGARRICLSDTVGHATPDGARALVRFAREEIVKPSGESVKVDWHGHKDRGLDLMNTLAAAEAGADRLHGCALGIGERSGNTPMELILVNLKLLGWRDLDLSRLMDYCRTVSEACGVPIPKNYPVVGSDAFQTGTGVHAAAVIKAFRKKNEWLADRVYSSVPSSFVGREQEIRVGPMSGKSNVIFWLERRGHRAADEVVERIFEAAKASPRLLEDEEIEKLLG